MAAHPPAGWYGDPAGLDDERWWDGTAWTDRTRPRAPGVGQDAGPPPGRRRRAVVWSALAAGAVIVGALGVVVLLRGLGGPEADPTVVADRASPDPIDDPDPVDEPEPVDSPDEPEAPEPPEPDADPVPVHPAIEPHEGSAHLTVALTGGSGLPDLIEEFEDAHPLITIDVRVSDWGDHHDHLVSSLASGSGAPDVALVDADYIQSLAVQPGFFHDLFTLGAGHLESDYLDWKWAQATSPDGGALIGLPFDIGSLAVCYRSDLFDAAGLESDRDALTQVWGSWDDFLTFGERYVEATGLPFLDDHLALWNTALNQSPETYYGRDGAMIHDRSPQVAGTWARTIRAIDHGVVADAPTWSAAWEQGFTDGSFAAALCPVWMLGYIQDVAPAAAGKWDISSLPEGGGNWGGGHLVVPAQSAYPRAAFDLIRWLTAPEQQLRAFTDNGNYPSAPALYGTPSVQSFRSGYFNDAPVGAIYADSALAGIAAYRGPDHDVIDHAFRDALTQVADGVLGANAAWDAALARIDDMVG